MPKKTSGSQDQATKPVWVNLRFQYPGGHGDQLRTALVHGLPPIGAMFDAPDGFGTVTSVCYAPALDGSYKATIEIGVERT